MLILGYAFSIVLGMDSVSPTSPPLLRLVAMAQDLLLERGIGPVSLADVALALRLPLDAVERAFPAGKPALVAAVVGHYLM